MPRKVGPGPRIWRIELMSTGKEYRPVANDMRDDFGDHAPIEPIVDTSPDKPLVDSWVLQDTANRAKRVAHAELLKRLGGIGHIKPDPPAKVPLVPKGKRVIKIITTNKGVELSILKDKPDWRRF